MNNIVKKILTPMWFALYRTYNKWLIKCQTRHMAAVYFKTYIETFNLFPDNTLKNNSDISKAVNDKLFELPPSENLPDINDTEFNALHDAIIENDWVKKTISNYHLLNSFYWSHGIFSDQFKENIDESMKKAISFDKTATPITYEEAGILNKTIKSELKQLKIEVKELNSERLKSEKLKIINPVSIKATHVLFIASLFSTLFLISGFIYNKILFGIYGINVGDFFEITDYLASSVNIITTTAISSLFGMIFYYWGVSDSITEDLHIEQFETERSKEGEYFIVVIVLTSVLALILNSYNTGKFSGSFAFPLILYISIYIYFRLPIRKYIENKAEVDVVLIAIIFFCLRLGVNINDHINDIESNKYKIPYTLAFKNEYKKYSEFPFFAVNSSYVFLLNKDKIIAIPKTGVESYKVK